MYALDEYHAEMQRVDKRCAEFQIAGEWLSVTDAAKIIGCTRQTARNNIRFGGTNNKPQITRSQLARQLAEMGQYRVKEPS